MHEVRRSILKKLEKVFEKDGFSFQPRPYCNGGIIRTKCPHCGGTVHTVGKGILREECADCGKPYHEPRIG